MKLFLLVNLCNLGLLSIWPRGNAVAFVLEKITEFESPSDLCSELLIGLERSIEFERERGEIVKELSFTFGFVLGKSTTAVPPESLAAKLR